MKILKILVFKKSIINFLKRTCIFAISNLSIAQSDYLNLDVENDLYFLTDEYYSSGIFIEKGKVVEKDSIKKFKIWELGQEIYTPSDTDSKDFENYDYPFGGWTFLKYVLQIEKNNNRFIEYGFQFGLTGEWSLADKMQNFYHKKIINADISTWGGQIPKALHFNMFTSYYFQTAITPKIFLFRKFKGILGTQRIAIETNFGLNYGVSVNDKISNPLFLNSKGLGAYLGVNPSFVFHDFMLSGQGFQKEEALFTAKSKILRLTLDFGLSYKIKNWKFVFIYKNRTPDNFIQPLKQHHYNKLSVSYFFN